MKWNMKRHQPCFQIALTNMHTFYIKIQFLSKENFYSTACKIRELRNSFAIILSKVQFLIVSRVKEKLESRESLLRCKFTGKNHYHACSNHKRKTYKLLWGLLETILCVFWFNFRTKAAKYCCKLIKGKMKIIFVVFINFVNHKLSSI